MSRVTNVILHVSILEENECEDGPLVQVVALNRVLSAEDYKTSFERVDQYAGGGKVFEATVFMAAFNHAATYELLRLIRARPWTYPDEVQVFVKEEEEEGFTIYGIKEERAT